MQVIAPRLLHSDWLHFSGVYGTIITFALVPSVVSPFPVEDGSRMLLTYKKMKLSVLVTHHFKEHTRSNQYGFKFN